MTIEGYEQYWLRPMRIEDVRVIAQWWEEVEDLTRFHRRMPLPLGADALEAVWAEVLVAREPRASYWFMIDDFNRRPVGLGGIEDINYAHGNAVTPVFISEPVRGKGIGMRARALLLDLAFDQLALVRITSFHWADNIASRRINEACGLREEGRLRKAWRMGGESVDLMVFGILAEEWRKRRVKLRETLSARTVVTLGSDPTGSHSWPTVPAAG